MAIVGAALFSVFLFMTFYMQQILRFSPVKTGLGFLPLTGAIIIVAPLVQTKILPRLGPRGVITTGMILGVIAMIIFTRLTPGGSYATHVLPGLILAGAGAACVVSASFATGTLGVRHTDAGIASAVINTSQQIGGSIGTALLSAIFAGSWPDTWPATPAQPTRPPSRRARVHRRLHRRRSDLRHRPPSRPGPAPLAACHPSPGRPAASAPKICRPYAVDVASLSESSRDDRRRADRGMPVPAY